jgi:hypothetical protein
VDASGTAAGAPVHEVNSRQRGDPLLRPRKPGMA